MDLTQETVLPPRLEDEEHRQDREHEDGPPRSQRDRVPDSGQKHRGIDGMPDERIRPVGAQRGARDGKRSRSQGRAQAYAGPRSEECGQRDDRETCDKAQGGERSSRDHDE